MWSIRLAFLLFIVRRTLPFPPWPFVILHSLHDRCNWPFSISLQHHISKLPSYFSSTFQETNFQPCSKCRTCLFFLFPWASAASHRCTAACWLIVPPALDVPTLATTCPRAYRRVPHSSGGSWNLWAGIRTDNFAQMPTSTVHLGFFYMPQICDMGPTALLPFRRKACWGFFRP
jgi:hypothetical protein